MELLIDELQHYSRHLLLEDVGTLGQLKLKRAKVVVIGAGGLSCPVLQYLTAAGVGTIGIVDDDIVEQSNLQRQILYKYDDIGKSKVDSAVKRLQGLNPYIKFNKHITRLSTKNALSILAPYDIIVDGTDNFPTRYLINDAAVLLQKPIVFGSIHIFQGQVSVFNLENGPTYRCLYPTPPESGTVPNCSETGVLGILPGLIGSLQANEVLKIILSMGKILSGQLLKFDALSMKQSIFKFERNSSLNIQSLTENYSEFCDIDSEVKELSFQEYSNQASEYNLLDVRTQDERNVYSIESVHIPLLELSNRYHEIPGDKNLLVFCKSGLRSKMAIKILKKKGFEKELVNLKFGLQES